MSTYTPSYKQSQDKYNHFARLDVELEPGKRKTVLSLTLPDVPYSNSVSFFQPRRIIGSEAYKGRIRGIVIEDQSGAMGEELIISIRHQRVLGQNNKLGLDILVMANENP